MKEDNIMIESKHYYIHYCFDSTGLYISCYDKNRKQYLFENYSITNPKAIKLIRQNVDNETGFLIKKANVRFMTVMNNDDKMKIYPPNTDKTNADKTITERVNNTIKRWWLNGFGI